MKCYYNEFDRKKAEWLRELIKEGVIADGDVDERSINDVIPTELTGYSQWHFFAGVGIWSYALRRAGWSDNRPVVTVSCPCQSFSVAGKGKGFADERHLWPSFFHIISSERAFRGIPIFGEQVASADGLTWLDLVCDDLEAAGYAVRPFAIPACGFGSPHKRERLYFVADTSKDGRNGRGKDNGREEKSEGRMLEPSRSGTPSTVVESIGKGLEGHRGNVTDGHKPGRISTDEIRSITEAGTISTVADAVRGRREQRDAEEWTLSELNPNQPTNGYWRDAAWLPCSDGKHRAAAKVESRFLSLANVPSDDLGCLCDKSRTELKAKEKQGEKINGISAKRATDEMVSAMPSAADQKENERKTRRSERVPSPQILQPEVHGSSLRRDTSINRPEQQTAGTKNGQTQVRIVQQATQWPKPACSSCRSQPIEQQSCEFKDVMSLLPRSFTFAQLRGDVATEKALFTLFEAIGKEAALQYASYSPEKVWRSLTDEDTARVEMGFNQSRWVIREWDDLYDDLGYMRIPSGENIIHPLIEKERCIAAALRLKGYGDGIVAEQAAEFIRAAMEII